jgi:lipopolysaccharide biosynthesis protein
MSMNKKIWPVAAAIVLAVMAAVMFLGLNRPKRYAVLAGYNGDGTIHPYVITYLKVLNEVADGVVYIADSTLKPEEEEKLKGLTIHYENVRHEEYDFGSYKRGFNWLKDNGYLKEADEVIFANDSCYAPMTSFKPMFKEMAKRKDLDFWGNTQSAKFNPHLQSYFLVFRKKVLHSPSFMAFLNRIHHWEYPAQYIAEYELNLTPHLENHGYRWDSYQPYTSPATPDTPDLNSFPLTLVKERGNQFIKRRIFTSSLMNYENEGDLLRYVYELNPARYFEIAQEIPEWFIPEDLKEKKNAH